MDFILNGKLAQVKRFQFKIKLNIYRALKMYNNNCTGDFSISTEFFANFEKVLCKFFPFYCRFLTSGRIFFVRAP